MNPLLLSLGAGAFVGLIYALLKVRSPAPPAVALVGLLGMVIGSSLGGKLLHSGSLAWAAAGGQTQIVAAKHPVPLLLLAKQAG
ncbi:DUF1427 family protein [Kalamiella sp. sgz302252]|uniref:DUF1427 family protein n=1 Tax=Pantoea sp. sgz302252 TaxID=3341827 RepID=UPI0036D31B7A